MYAIRNGLQTIFSERMILDVISIGWGIIKMKYNEERIDEIVLALLHLTTFKEKYGGYRAWKGMDWDVMNRLFDKGYISDPKSKAKSVGITEEAVAKSKELFEKHFGV